MNEISQTDRRDFLKIAWSVMGAAVLAEAGGVALAFSQPRIAEGSFGSVITAGHVDEFPPGSVTPFNEGRFYLIRLADGGLLAVYRKCTHLGCAVPWDPVVGQFVCPCHSAVFDGSGDVVESPAPRPLDLFPVAVEAGVIRVDTGTIFQRDMFEISQVVYA